MNPARSDNRDIDPSRQRQGLIDVSSPHHPVSINIGVNNTGHARALEPYSQIESGLVSHLFPPSDGDFALFRIQTNNDLIRELTTCFINEPRIFNCTGTQNDIINTQTEVALNRLHIPNAATNLNDERRISGSDAPDNINIGIGPLESTI